MTVDQAVAPLVLLFAALLASFVLTAVVTRLVRRLGMYDLPGERHSHTEITPRGGGAGLLLALFAVAWFVPAGSAATAFWLHCLLPGAVLLAALGWWDDMRDLSARLRFAFQLLASAWLLVCAGVMPSTVLGGLLAVLALLGLVWMTNLYNFMDGSNGMAGAQGVFAGSVLAWLFVQGGDPEAALFSALLATSCMGFLPWNLGRAKVFLGDVASGTLGFIIAALLFYGSYKGIFSAAVAWLVMVVFVCDSTVTLLYRVNKGERWYTAHKQHLYQQLIGHGWSHGKVLLLYQLINLVLVVPVIAVAVNYPAWAAVMAWSVSVALVLGWFVVKRKLGVLA